MGMSPCFIVFGFMLFISFFFRGKFDGEIMTMQYYGYEDLDIDESVLKQGPYYNFGHYSLKLRFLTFEVESIQGDQVVWESPIDQSFIACGLHKPQINPNEDSFYTIDDSVIQRKCKQQVITSIKKLNNISVRIEGTFHDCLDAIYSIEFTDEEGIDGKPKLGFKAECHSYDTELNRVYLRTRSSPLESIYGLGEQFSYLNLKGRIFNTFVREKGIGRGDEPLTTLINLLYNNAGGRYSNTYSPSTIVVSSFNRSIYIDTTSYSIWDFQDIWSLNIMVWDSKIRGQIFNAPDLKKLITRVTQITGRMKQLPGWISKGAIIGIQGGTDKLLQIYEKLEQNDVPIAGFWIQDWVNKRISEGYSRLWWNWELDQSHYPNWNQTIQKLQQKGVRLLTYINPMLTDVTSKKHDRNLYEEAKSKGYMIYDRMNKQVFSTRAFSNFTAGLLDLTNPDAINWYKQIIKEELLGKTQVSGFMADFGESAPISKVNVSLFDKNMSLMEFHQTYPLLWQRLVSEAVSEYAAEKDIPDDFVFFTRSGFTQTANLTRLVWAGDQNMNWGRHNGIKSGVVAMLSGGFSGLSYTHTDIGGYTFIDSDINKYYQFTKRDKDLLIRWLELSAFSCVFRSHEGNKPDKTIQPYDDDMIHYLRRNAYLFRLLDEYRYPNCKFFFIRQSLFKSASRYGIPDDPNVVDIIDQFMLGSELLVAPVLEPNSYQRKVYFPKIATKYQSNFWVNAWTGERFQGCQCYKLVNAPYDQPPAFYQLYSDWDKQFKNIFDQVKKIN